MLSFQNPHHLSASGASMPRTFGSSDRLQDPGSIAGFGSQPHLAGTFKSVGSKMENLGNEEAIQEEETDGAARSHSHSSDSISGSASGERRKEHGTLKRRREEEEEEEEEEAEGGEERKERMLRLSKSEDEDEVDDDDEDEDVDGDSDCDEDGMIQKEILTQKPLGLLAQHGLSNRVSGSARYQKNDADDERLRRLRQNIGIIDRNGGIKDRDGRIIDRDGRIIDRDGGITDCDDGAKDRDGRIIDRDGRIIDRDGRIIDRDGRIINRTDGVRYRDSDGGIINRDSGIVNRDSGIINRDSGIINRDGRVIDRDCGIADRDGGIINRDSGVRSHRDDGIEDRDSRIRDRDDRIQDRDGRITGRDGEIRVRDEVEEEDDDEDGENRTRGSDGDLKEREKADEPFFHKDTVQRRLSEFTPQSHGALSDNDLGGRGCNFTSHISLMDQRFMPSPPLSASPESAQDPSAPGHHWTFEEQFKQLYELSDDPNRKLFLDDLFSFMQKRGTPVNRIPIMAKQTLDLFELFQLVVSKGGLVEVINKKLWREITKGLNLPSSITSAAFTLRTQYMKYLYPYECDKLKLSTLSELQYAVDGNRREGRRSGFAQEFSPLPPMLPINPAAVAHLHDPLQGVNHTGRPPVSLSLNERDQMMLAPTVNQLRTLAECDAQAVKAATRAMAEVTKRMEEATRAAAVAAAAAASNPIRLQGSGAVPCPPHPPPGPNNNPLLKLEEPLTKRSALEDGVRFQTPLQQPPGLGVSTAHIKLTSRENGHSNHLGSSIIGSMEINGILYQGVLFAQPPPTHLLE